MHHLVQYIYLHSSWTRLRLLDYYLEQLFNLAGLLMIYNLKI